MAKQPKKEWKISDHMNNLNNIILNAPDNVNFQGVVRNFIQEKFTEQLCWMTDQQINYIIHGPRNGSTKGFQGILGSRDKIKDLLQAETEQVNTDGTVRNAKDIQIDGNHIQREIDYENNVIEQQTEQLQYWKLDILPTVRRMYELVHGKKYVPHAKGGTTNGKSATRTEVVDNLAKLDKLINE